MSERERERERERGGSKTKGKTNTQGADNREKGPVHTVKSSFTKSPQVDGRVCERKKFPEIIHTLFSTVGALKHRLGENHYTLATNWLC